jgi:hypothetical protein
MEPAICEACDLDYECREFLRVRPSGTVMRHVLKL